MVMIEDSVAGEDCLRGLCRRLLQAAEAIVFHCEGKRGLKSLEFQQNFAIIENVLGFRWRVR